MSVEWAGEALEEKYIQFFQAKLTSIYGRKVTAAEASNAVMECITTTALAIGTTRAKIYALVTSEEYLRSQVSNPQKSDLSGPSFHPGCSKMELDKCKDCKLCVEFEGKCHPRYFKDADQINKDPDAYVNADSRAYTGSKGAPRSGISTVELGQMLRLASYLYYNFDGGGLSDNSFDALEYLYNKRIKQSGRRYEKIGAPPVEKIRTKLPYPMASLNKAKPGTGALLNFLDQTRSSSSADSELPNGIPRSGTHPSDVLASLKLDGVSAMVVYTDGIASALYTRGDGTVGGNISFLIEYLKLPRSEVQKHYPNIVVRGELIVSKKNWEDIYSQTNYSNARSMVSAKVNSGYISFGLEFVEFVAYEIIATNTKIEATQPSQHMEILDSIGFKTPDYVKLTNPTTFDLMELYKTKRSGAAYSIDGLVLTIDRPHIRPKEAVNPTYSIAFKMRLEDAVRKSVITSIDWNISRYGRLVPVGIYESVYVDGIRMHRASLFNAARVRDWHVTVGTKIRVVRSGDVIPTIIDAVVDPLATPLFPPTTAPYGKWHWEGSDIVLDDIEGNQMVHVKRMEHFFSVIGAKGVGEVTLFNLYTAGYKTISSITNISDAKGFEMFQGGNGKGGLSRPESRKVKGVGAKRSVTLFASVQHSLATTRIDRYLEASSQLKGLGRKLIKQLMAQHPDIIKKSSTEIREFFKKNKVSGIGAKRIDMIAEGIPEFKTFLYGLNEKAVKQAIQREERLALDLKHRGYNPLIKGKSFVFTGFMGKTDFELEDYIYDNQGSIDSTVSSSTQAVISGNVMEASKKMIAAHNLKVKVLTINEFIHRYVIGKGYGGESLVARLANESTDEDGV